MSDAPVATKIRNQDEISQLIEKHSFAQPEAIESPFLEYQRQLQSPPADKFQPPTRDDLSKSNSTRWDRYAESATKTLDEAHQNNLAPTRVDVGHDTPRQYAERMKAHTQSELDKLTDKDLEVVGKVGQALQRGDVLMAWQAMHNAYNEDYDKEAVANVATGIRLELFRRGLNFNWDVSMSTGDEGAYGVYTDLRAKGLQYPGLASPNYSFTLGHPEKN